VKTLFWLAWAAAFVGAFWTRWGAPHLYDNQWGFLVVLGAALAVKELVFPRFGLAASALFLWAIGNAAWFWLWRQSMYEFVHPYDKQALGFFIADGIAKLALVVLPVALAMKDREKAKEAGGLLFTTVMVCNAAMVIHQFFATGKHCTLENTCGGFLGNPSINDTAMVLMLPLAMKFLLPPLNWAAVLAVGFSVCVSQSRVGVGLLCVVFLLEAAWRRRWVYLSALPLLAVPAKLFVRKDFGGTGDRAGMWDFFMRLLIVKPGYHFGSWKDWWHLGRRTRLPHLNLERAHDLMHKLHWQLIPTGSGYGTYGVMARNLQGWFSKNPRLWWAFMHNDWLEGFAFDLGLVGLALAVWVYCASLKGFLKRGERSEATALILLGLGMGMNYPLHLGLTSAFAAWLVLLGLMRSDPA
jgi:hypothetical protein